MDNTSSTGQDTSSSFRTLVLSSASDGLPISVLCSTPGHNGEQKARGIVQLVHGMCEHKERYIPFMKFLSENGYICVIHDHRGHGSSVKDSQDLGYFYEGGYLAMIQDIRMVTEWVKSEYRGLSVILFGHSMGSMAVRSYTKRYDNSISGLIVCGSPSYNPGIVFGKILSRLYSAISGSRCRPKLIQAIAFGMFNRKFRKEGSSNAWICSDPEIVASYDSNPLCSFQFTANGFSNLFSLMQDAYGKKGWQLYNPHLPILFISGKEDPCLVSGKKFHQSVRFMEKCGYDDVTSHLYPEMRHEILNEKGKKEVWEDILEFINQNI